MNFLLFFAWAHNFALPVKLPLSQPMSFCTSTLLKIFPRCPGLREIVWFVLTGIEASQWKYSSPCMSLHLTGCRTVWREGKGTVGNMPPACCPDATHLLLLAPKEFTLQCCHCLGYCCLLLDNCSGPRETCCCHFPSRHYVFQPLLPGPAGTDPICTACHQPSQAGGFFPLSCLFPLPMVQALLH